MAIQNNKNCEIPPTHPGEMLREDFMPDFNLNATSMAKAIGISRQTNNELPRERRSITSKMALRLFRIFGNSPDSYLKAQYAKDLLESEQRYYKEMEKIQPLNAA
jgi:addiction module HigA family antidote